MAAATSRARVRPRRLLCDVMLGRLARWLRALGHDVAYDHAADDRELMRRAARERRTLVTRDTRLGPARGAVRILLLRANDTPGQLSELVEALGMREHPGLLTRCIACGAALRRAGADDVEARIPAYVKSTQRDFRQCPGCARLYWPGTHRRELLAALEAALPGVTGRMIRSRPPSGAPGSPAAAARARRPRRPSRPPPPP